MFTTEIISQNHGTAEVGRQVLRSSSPTPQVRVSQSRFHRAVSGWALDVSKDGDSTTSPGSLVPTFDHPHKK